MIVELSVVIPAFNAESTIADQLAALLRQEWNHEWEVLVIDNGSTDHTADIVAQYALKHPKLRLLDGSGHRGASYARNLGVSKAHGKSIAFCDADDVVGDDWVAAMGSALSTYDLVTGPQELDRLNPEWLRGCYGTAQSRGPQAFAGLVPFGPTANLGIRRELFERLGGFNISIAVYEDLELCLRAWLDDVELHYSPDAVVHYRLRPDIRSLWRQAVTYGAAGPHIARQLKESGRPTPPRFRGIKNWLWLLRSLPSLRTKSGRAHWIVVAAGATGRLEGSVRARYLFL